MSEPRLVVLTWSSFRRLTQLELARALATSGVRLTEWEPMFRAQLRGELDADQLLGIVTLEYAVAWQLARRDDPATTWSDVQSWRVEFDATASLDELAELEATVSVEAAVISGLPPSEAGELTVSQLEAYRTVRERAG